VFSLGLAAETAAQPAERFEVAANLSLLRVSDFGSTNAGIGGRLSLNLTDAIALEGEVGFFPHDSLEGRPTTLGDDTFFIASDRTRTDVLFGVKAGTRHERWGVFGKARPGITRLTDRGTRCVGEACARILMLIARNTYRTEFAFDFGGGLEIYPSARTVARVEIGDTFIRHRSTAPPCPASACTSHNLSSRIGIGYRF
jgi:hypothetical protein